MTKTTRARPIEAGWTTGVDLGDRHSEICIVDGAGEVVSQQRVATTPDEFTACFSALPRLRVAMEAGTHSPWVSRLIAGCGHEVFVGNPRRMRSIRTSSRKSDRCDAEEIARLARSDLAFLCPITHRSVEAQRDLTLIHARDALVRTRTLLVQHVRCTLKSWGVLVRKCSPPVFPKRLQSATPAELKPALLPAIEVVALLNERIRGFDESIARIAAERHPVAGRMCAIAGVGTLTALAYVLAVADVRRFAKSRDVGAYFGLTPRRGQSGASNPQLRITRAGNSLVRRLLVGAGRYILGPYGPDCDLRRFGARLVTRGGRSARTRAAVAVARKLAVLLHRMWVTGEEYQLLHSRSTAATAAAAAAKRSA